MKLTCQLRARRASRVHAVLPSLARPGLINRQPALATFLTSRPWLTRTRLICLTAVDVKTTFSLLCFPPHESSLKTDFRYCRFFSPAGFCWRSQCSCDRCRQRRRPSGLLLDRFSCGHRNRDARTDQPLEGAVVFFEARRHMTAAYARRAMPRGTNAMSSIAKPWEFHGADGRSIKHDRLDGRIEALRGGRR